MPHLLHASGRFNESPAWLKRDLIRWRELAGIITLTEVARADRKAALRRKGWRLTSGRGEGPGECAILSDRRQWRGVERFVEPITDGGGKDRLSNPICAVTDVLHRRGTGKVLIVSVAHMPAHVETLLRLGRKAQPATSWHQAANCWARHIAEVRAKYPDAEVWAVSDTNVNLQKDWAVALMRKGFEPAGKDLRIFRTVGETLEDTGRSIDGALSTMTRDTAETHKAEASDHLAVRFRVGWPLRKKQP